jgi:hypothetical protein
MAALRIAYTNGPNALQKFVEILLGQKDFTTLQSKITKIV